MLSVSQLTKETAVLTSRATEDELASVPAMTSVARELYGQIRSSASKPILDIEREEIKEGEERSTLNGKYILC